MWPALIGMRWALVAALVVLLATACGVQTTRLANTSAVLERERARFALATAAASERARAQEQAWQDEQHEQIRLHEKVVADLRADSVAAGVEHDRLRDAARALAGRRCAAAPAVAGASSPAADPAFLLADVLGRVDARAGELASYADELRAAGELCVGAAR